MADEKDKEIQGLRRKVANLERRIKELQAQDYNAYKDGYIAGCLDTIKQARQWIDETERGRRTEIAENGKNKPADERKTQGQ